jgi:hypothetical protein
VQHALGDQANFLLRTSHGRDYSTLIENDIFAYAQKLFRTDYNNTIINVYQNTKCIEYAAVPSC